MGVNMCTEASHAAGQRADAHPGRSITDSTDFMEVSMEDEGAHSREESLGEDTHMNRDAIFRFAAIHLPRVPSTVELPQFSRQTTTPSPAGSAPATPQSHAWSLEQNCLMPTTPKGSLNSDLTHLTTHSLRELSRDDSKTGSTLSDVSAEPAWMGADGAQVIYVTQSSVDRTDGGRAAPDDPNMLTSSRSHGSSVSRQLSEVSSDPTFHFAVDSLTTTTWEANFWSLESQPQGSWGAEELAECPADL